MNILLIGSYGPSVLNFRGPLIKSLLSEGHSLVVTAPGISDEDEETLSQLGVTVKNTVLNRTGLNIFADFIYFKSIRRLIDSYSIDFVVTYTVKPNIWGAFAAYSKKIQSISMITGLGFAFTGSNMNLRRLLIQRVLSFLYSLSTACNSKVIFQNSDDRDCFIKERCLRDRKKAYVVNGSGVDTSHYGVVPLPTAPTSFIMISRLLVNKGVREYCEAALHVLSKFPESKFYLLGESDIGTDGVSPDELARWIESGVIYLGSQKDVRPYIRKSHVLVLPSYREGTPRSVLEGMSMGRAIITTNVPGCKETTIHGHSGLVVEKQDSANLANAMIELIECPEKIKLMGSNGREIALNKYDVKKVNNKLLEIFDLT